ncbi:hypothetical protein G7050_08245 [Dysgonomonas sp. HDW5A]|uniref:hypothetical protein n=1 Tax=Dysgonomonas sp. HDW5A TaxID=2714926 RepID=UPI00140D210F|nr:hypothetical protein [Dysgonomonas sp. HDW5A]QIK59822.1 hypothetical protein G7050_08245 [Dysgonomonas sp. HDW5A]
MEHRCLSREEYQYLIHQLIYGNQLTIELEEELIKIIDRAQNYWDVNIIGINYFLSIITEQIMKRVNVDNELINQVYDLKNKMYFTIDELDYKLINELFSNNLPEARNYYTAQLEEAKRGKDEKLVLEIENLRSQSFEEDLLRVIENFYEAEIYH